MAVFVSIETLHYDVVHNTILRTHFSTSNISGNILFQNCVNSNNSKLYHKVTMTTMQALASLKYHTKNLTSWCSNTKFYG